MSDHGMVLKPEHIDYSDIEKFGSVTISFHADRGIEVYSEGFEFEEAHSCRQASAKALAWARDVLDTAVRADMLIPGGLSRMSNGCD